MKMTSSSYPKFLSVLGWRKKSLFLLILCALDAVPASFLLFFKGGLVMQGKNLKDDVGLLLVGYVFFFFFFQVLF